MVEGEFDRLFEKYKKGDSTLNEEKKLFDNSKNSEQSLAAWSTFVKNNKTKTPKDFNDTLWESFENKKTRKRRRYTGIISAAASVILLISLLVGNQGQEELSYSEKEALLNEALNLFPTTSQAVINQSIIYENEMIIVYTTTE